MGGVGRGGGPLVLPPPPLPPILGPIWGAGQAEREEQQWLFEQEAEAAADAARDPLVQVQPCIQVHVHETLVQQQQMQQQEEERASAVSQLARALSGTTTADPGLPEFVVAQASGAESGPGGVSHAMAEVVGAGGREGGEGVLPVGRCCGCCSWEPDLQAAGVLLLNVDCLPSWATEAKGSCRADHPATQGL